MKWIVWTHLVSSASLFLVFITPLFFRSLRLWSPREGVSYSSAVWACMYYYRSSSNAATDSAATVVMRTDDCAWKQRRSGLIRLGSASERLLAGVGGRLMRKHKASAGLSLSVFVCVWAAQRSGMSESLQPHRPTHTHTHTHTLLKPNELTHR